MRCLNQLAGFPDERSWPIFPKNQAQAASQKHIVQCHLQRARPVERMSEQEALRQLLAKRAGYGDSPGSLASLVVDRLSLPKGQERPVSLGQILPKEDAERLKDFEEKMLLSPEERAAVIERGFSDECFLDPVLQHNVREYHRFIAELYACNLLHFTCSPKVQIGAFAVTKKNGKQRLIIDARRTNRLFRTPPSTLLGSVDTWTRLEVPRDADVFVAQEDVKDYFYRLGIPLALGEFFSLPAIDPQVLMEIMGTIPQEVAELLDTHEAPIFPCMAVLPMGFSWAFHLAHQAHTYLANQALLQVKLLRDRSVAPRLQSSGGDGLTAMLIYADNNNHVGIDRDAVQSDQDLVMEILHKCGLATHDVEAPSSLAESLGVRIDGLSGTVGPTPKRDWRLDRALGACNGRVKLSGKELQVIVGHITVRALLHRGLMGIMRHCYAFIERNYEVRTTLWGSVRQELYMFRHLMSLGQGSIKQEWGPTMYCTDACLSGYAVMSSVQGKATVREIGRNDERWRFRLGEGYVNAPRRQALDTAGVFSDPLTVLPEVDGEVPRPVELSPLFPDVLPEVMEASRWSRSWCTPIQYQEPVHMVEARSILGAVKHIVRDSRTHGQKHVILNDNMGVVLAMQKGRCCDFGLLRVVRRVSAHLLASGTRVHVRWIPSEMNVADKDSRLWEPETKPARVSGVFGASDFRFPSRCHVTTGDCKAKGGCAHERGGQGDQPATPEGGSQHDPATVGIFAETFADEGDAQPPEAESEGLGSHTQEEKGESRAEEAEVRDASESHSRGTGAAGDAFHKGAPTARLLAEVGRLLRLHRPVRDPDRHRGTVGRSLVRVRRPAVPGRVREQLRGEAHGGNRVHPAGVRSRRYLAPSTFQAVSERLEAFGAQSGEDANARVLEVRREWFDACHGKEGDGFVQRGHFLDLRSPRRDAPRGSHGRGDAHKGAGACNHRLGPHGEGRILEGRGFRRGPHPGRCEGPFPSSTSEPSGPSEDKGRWGGCELVDVQRQGLPHCVENVCFHIGDREFGDKPLSKSTWRCKPRSFERSSFSPRDSPQGSMGQRLISPSVRQAGEAPTDVIDVRGPVPRLWGEYPVKFRKLLPQWWSGPASRAESPLMLSLFGGVGECARAFAHQGGIAAVIDLETSIENDLSDYAAWNDISNQLPHFDLIGIDLPCNTWSRARRGKPGSGLPEPLRGAQGRSLFGLPHLCGRDSIKVQQANTMLYGAYRIIRRCLKLHIPGYLENPQTSLLWKTPQMKRLLRLRHVHLIGTDLCQYGVPWKKATYLLVWNCMPFPLRTCAGRGKCSRTNRPHLQLSGLSSRVFLTKQAQVYPRPFAQALISGLVTHRLSAKLPPPRP